MLKLIYCNYTEQYNYNRLIDVFLLQTIVDVIKEKDSRILLIKKDC